MERRVLIVIALILAAVFLIVLFAIDCAGAEDMFILCKPGSTVNIRNRPRKDAAVVAWIECGQRVQTDGKEKGGFVHVVNLPSEITEGWIFAGYVADEEPVIREYTAEVWEGDVIARSSMGGKRVCKLKEGKTVTVYAKTHSWAVTSRGYILCDWLKEVE